MSLTQYIDTDRSRHLCVAPKKNTLAFTSQKKMRVGICFLFLNNLISEFLFKVFLKILTFFKHKQLAMVGNGKFALWRP